MELYACGLNAHKQLTPDTDSQNITTFRKIAAGRQVKVLRASWCATILELDGQLEYHGHHASGLSDCLVNHTDDLRSLFDGIQGIQGALTTDGHLLDLLQDNSRSNVLTFQRSKGIWREGEELSLKHVAIAGNGQVAVVAHTRRPASRKRPDNLYMFSSIVDLRAPACSDSMTVTAVLQGITLLGSTATSFVALNDGGTVLSWGSALHPHLLGRHPTKDSSAEIPHPVSFLEGTPIRKIAAGGWICAAISREDDMYIWGGQPGGDTLGGRIDSLPEWNAGEDIKLVYIEGGVDILDAAVGEGHIIVLTKNGKVWAAGEGHEGQLGLGVDDQRFEQSWKIIYRWDHRQVLSVEASGWDTFVIVKKD